MIVDSFVDQLLSRFQGGVIVCRHLGADQMKSDIVLMSKAYECGPQSHWSWMCLRLFVTKVVFGVQHCFSVLDAFLFAFTASLPFIANDRCHEVRQAANEQSSRSRFHPHLLVMGEDG